VLLSLTGFGWSLTEIHTGSRECAGFEITHTPLITHSVEVIKPIAALLSDLDQGPFRVLIIDSIICES
jgi:hypothetical protein